MYKFFILFCIFFTMIWQGMPVYSQDDELVNTQEEEATVFNKSFTLSGFMSVYFMDVNSDDDNVYKSLLTPNPSFSQSKFHLYMNSKFAPNWRVFAEIRFLYVPNNSGVRVPVGIDGDGNTIYNISNQTNTTFLEGDGHPDEWNTLKIERAFIEWRPAEKINFRFGKYLTPFGIWNQDHGDPILISLKLPYMLLLRPFPPAQTGINAFGWFFWGDKTVLKYDIFTGNGEGRNSDLENDDQHFSVGGRLSLELFEGVFTIGVSYYHGDKTEDMEYMELKNVNGEIYPSWPGDYIYGRVIKNVAGADVKLELGNFIFQAEAIYHYSIGKKNSEGKKTIKDFSEKFFYTQVEYTFFERWTPYFRFEYTNMIFNNQIFPSVKGEWEKLGYTLYYGNDIIFTYSFGLNYRPIPPVVVKLDYSITRTHSDGPNYNLSMYTMGISVAF